MKAKKFAESLRGKMINKGEYLGRGYRVECLPEFYAQILWHLTEKQGYTYCYYNADTHYGVDDDINKKIKIAKLEKRIEEREL